MFITLVINIKFYEPFIFFLLLLFHLFNSKLQCKAKREHLLERHANVKYHVGKEKKEWLTVVLCLIKHIFNP